MYQGVYMYIGCVLRRQTCMHCLLVLSVFDACHSIHIYFLFKMDDDDDDDDEDDSDVDCDYNAQADVSQVFVLGVVS